MKIGIDISQLAYPNTGVSNYLQNLVVQLVQIGSEHEFILFYSSLRRNFQFSSLNFQSIPENVKVKTFKIPPTLLDLLWNRLHVAPIENFIGPVDVFITSDWTEPPSQKAKKITILYDLVIYKYPEETAQKIVDVQKRKLEWVKKDGDFVFCISQSTKKDAEELLGISSSKLQVIYPGLSI